MTLIPFQIAILIWSSSAMAATTPSVPPEIAGRNLLTLSELKIQTQAQETPTVIVFLSAHCPCSMSHEPTLKALAGEFKEVRFVGIHSNADEGTAESMSHFLMAALPFPVIQDTDAKLANQFGALKTPHVFVLNKKGELIFQGGVDDSHDASRATKPYLKSVLTALREGKKSPITQARSLGCVIRR